MTFRKQRLWRAGFADESRELVVTTDEPPRQRDQARGIVTSHSVSEDFSETNSGPSFTGS